MVPLWHAMPACRHAPTISGGHSPWPPCHSRTAPCHPVLAIGTAATAAIAATAAMAAMAMEQWLMAVIEFQTKRIEGEENVNECLPAPSTFQSNYSFLDQDAGPNLPGPGAVTGSPAVRRSRAT